MTYILKFDNITLRLFPEMTITYLAFYSIVHQSQYKTYTNKSEFPVPKLNEHYLKRRTYV